MRSVIVWSMHTKATIPFTEEGYAKIKQEYDQLMHGREAVVVELARARDQGDRSENAAYKSARWRLSGMDSRMRFLKKLLDYGKVMKPQQTALVELGTWVTIKNTLVEVTYQIVGAHEADPMKKKLSYNSPVGKALISRKVGENVEVDTPSGTITYQIIKIALEG